MFHQLEITTRCNFACWYCAGRAMPQQDMDWDSFRQIVDGIAEPGSTISLQGEGEPSLHPRFWDMVRYVRTKGHVPYTILNGSRINATLIARHFLTVGISIDTLDPAQAEKIGRHNLPKVLTNLQALLQVMVPKRIVIMTVDMGQPLDALRAWVQKTGFAQHVVQALMRKQDYVQHYPHMTFQGKRNAAPQTCRFVSQDVMRFYTWKGETLPCCFIKDTQGIVSIAALRSRLHAGDVPVGCAGCGELKAVEVKPVKFHFLEKMS